MVEARASPGASYVKASTPEGAEIPRHEQRSRDAVRLLLEEPRDGLAGTDASRRHPGSACVAALAHGRTEEGGAVRSHEPVHRVLLGNRHLGLDLHPPARDARAHERALRPAERPHRDDPLVSPRHPERMLDPPRLADGRRGGDHRERDGRVGHERRAGERRAERARERARIDATENGDGRVGLGLGAGSPEETKGARRRTERAPGEAASARRRALVVDEQVTRGEERGREPRDVRPHRCHHAEPRRVRPVPGELQVGVEVQDPGYAGSHASSRSRNASGKPARSARRALQRVTSHQHRREGRRERSAPRVERQVARELDEPPDAEAHVGNLLEPHELLDPCPLLVARGRETGRQTRASARGSRSRNRAPSWRRRTAGPGRAGTRSQNQSRTAKSPPRDPSRRDVPRVQPHVAHLVERDPDEAGAELRGRSRERPAGPRP